MINFNPKKRTVTKNERNASDYQETVNLFEHLKHMVKTGQKEELEGVVDKFLVKAENLFAIEDFYREVQELDDIQE